MRKFKTLALGLGIAVLMASCGGGRDGDQAPKVKFTSLVSFGDSLSDGDLAAPSEIWLDHLAAQYGLPAPCPVITGLNSSAPFGAPVAVSAVNTACKNYAQGGSRVEQLVGPANAALPAASGGAVGQLTYPVKQQIQNHGTFSGKELVTVMAGGNDAFMNGAAAAAVITASVTGAVGDIQAAAGAATIAGWSSADITTIATGGSSANLASTAAVMAMGTAGAQLAALVRTEIVGKGAKYVLVMNMPDLASSIYALENPNAVQLMAAMVSAFNTQLASGLSGLAGVTVGDAYTVSRDQYQNPAAYGLSNVTARACKRAPDNVLDGASLVCNVNNVITGDISKYLTADDVHPTPYGHKLLAQFATKVLATAGWL
jgi:outer membrane lipase/esterase